jgi:hypothetical protein
MDNREETIHFIRNVPEMGRNMRADINGFFSESTAELRYIGYRYVVESPQCVLVKSFNPFFEADLYTVRKEIVLPKQLLLLNSGVQNWIVLFSNRHNDSKTAALRQQSYTVRSEPDAIFSDAILRSARGVAERKAYSLLLQLILANDFISRCLQYFRQLRIRFHGLKELLTVSHAAHLP